MTKSSYLRSATVLAFVVALVSADSAFAQRFGGFGGGRFGGGGGGSALRFGGGGGGGSALRFNSQFSSQRFSARSESFNRFNNQRFNSQQFNSQRFNAQQLNSQRFNQRFTQRFNTQRSNNQRFNTQQLNNQRLNAQQLNSQRFNTRQLKTQRFNNQQLNALRNSNQRLTNQQRINGIQQLNGQQRLSIGNVGITGSVGNNNGSINIRNIRQNDGFNRPVVADSGKFGQFSPLDRATCSSGGGGAIGACGRITLLQTEPVRNRAAAHFNRAFLLERGGNFKEALEDYDASIRLDPADVDPYVNRARVWAKKQEARRAIEDLDAALKLDPKNVNALIQRGGQFDAERDTDKAVADFDTALQLAPNSVAALNDKAQALFRANRISEALSTINAALAIDANAANALDTRTRIFEALGQLDAAFADISKAIGIDGNDRELKRTFVEVKAKVDQARAPANPAQVAPVVAPLGEKRIALIIGNAKYTAAPDLKNTQSDALAIANKLAALGFNSVELGDDLKRDDMKTVLDSFAKKAKDADWAVIYYAGHGMEIGGNNWLIPVDAKVIEGSDIANQAVSLDEVIGSIENAKKLRLVILDACRDNPFGKVNQQGFARGLGRIEPAGATLVAYAAKHGQVASDGAGSHSPFMASLLKNLETPGLEINRLFRRVADEVFNTTKTQEPFTYGRLPDDDFYFQPVSTPTNSANAGGSFRVSSN